MRILFVTPYPLSRIRIRSYGFITQLARLHEIKVLTVYTGKQEASDVEEARRSGIAIMAIQDSYIAQYLRGLSALGTRLPLQVAFAASAAWRRALQQLLATEHFDVLHIESVRALACLPDTLPLPSVWDAVDCISQLYELGACSGSTLMMRCIGASEAQRLRSFEKQQLHRFQRVMVASERERQTFLRGMSPTAYTNCAPINVLSHGVDRNYFRTHRGPRQADLLIFSGKMSFHANVAGALYMVQHILPHIWSQRPGVRLIIAGANPPLVVRRLARDPRIEITGYLSDLRPSIAQAQVAVCPLPYAVGVQNKALEAMAMGTPVVATSCVAAGLATVAGRDLLVADEPEAFAGAVLRLLEDRPYREQLTQRGLTYIEAYHDWPGIIQKLITIYQTASLSTVA